MAETISLEGPVQSMLARWEQEIRPVEDQSSALQRLDAYIAVVSRLRLGNIVRVAYGADGTPPLSKVQDAPPAAHVLPPP